MSIPARRIVDGLAIVTALMAPAAGANACDFCSITNAIDARETRPGVVLGLEQQVTHFGTIRSGSGIVDDPVDQHLDSAITLLTVGYRFDERVGVQAVVPYIHRSFRRAENFEVDRGSEQGLGDVSLLAVATPWRRLGARTGVVVSVLAGIKAPTGDDDRLAEEADEVQIDDAPPSGYHGHDLALGTGSWDAVLGATALLRRGRSFVAADVQVLLRTPGGHDYRFADDLSGSVAAGGFVWFDDAGTLAVAARLSGEHKGEDRVRGERTDDTAVDALYLGPQLTATWRDRATASTGVELPLYQHVSGTQGVPDWRARVGVSGRF